MSENEIKAVCIEKFKNIVSDINDLKERNKDQDKELRSILNHFSTISEAVTEIKIINKQIGEVLDRMDSKIDNTDKKIEDLRQEVYEEKMNESFNWVKFVNSNGIPLLVVLGLIYFIMNAKNFLP